MSENVAERIRGWVAKDAAQCLSEDGEDPALTAEIALLMSDHGEDIAAALEDWGSWQDRRLVQLTVHRREDQCPPITRGLWDLARRLGLGGRIQ